MKKGWFIFYSLVGLVLGVAVLFLWASGEFQLRKNSEGKIVDFTAQQSYSKNIKLNLMTWNIAYGQSKGSGGEDYVPKTKEQMAYNLSEMARVIRESQADIVLIQEIDYESGRSHYIDQLTKIGSLSGLNYAAEAISWKAGYIPFPYWPPKNHFGKVRSGGAVLSRFPILKNKVILHKKPASQSWWYKAFYLYRYSQKVQIQIGDQTVWVINNHLDAFDVANRTEQAEALVKMVEEHAAEGPILVVGGDFNSTPPEAKKRTDYADEKCEGCDNDQTQSILRKMPGLREVVPVDEYAASEEKFFTFPAHQPSRRLDYLYVKSDAKVSTYGVVPAGEVSDHLPFFSRLEIAGSGDGVEVEVDETSAPKKQTPKILNKEKGLETDLPSSI